MSDNAPLRVADLAHNGANAFDIRPDFGANKALAGQLGLVSLRKLRFAGEIRAFGKDDWQISARLGATVGQPCVVTLSTVSTRIDLNVKRTLLAAWDITDDTEVEMNDDESIDPLGSHIDLLAMMAEALALALPLYPRAPGSDLDQATFTEPGLTPMSDESAKPFAGLAGLRDTLDKKD